MAEYKTLICDKCKKQEAIRIKFYLGRERSSSIAGDNYPVYKYADLCPTHMAEAYQFLVGAQATETQAELQRQWGHKD